MPSCEKCWADSQGDPYATSDYYRELVEERNKNGHVCTPEQQAGPDATHCPKCNRMTLHQYCHICMTPGCRENR